MTIRAKLLCALAVSGFAEFAAMPPQPWSMSECSEKYKKAKSAGTLNGQKWNDFRKAECGADAAAAPAPAPKEAAKKPEAAPASPMPVGNAVFPSAVDPKYANESAGKARMHTC